MAPNEHATTELIDKYLNGKLDKNTREEFEKRMQADEPFRQEVELQRAMQQQLHLYGRQQLRAQMQQWEREAILENRPTRSLWQNPWMYAAASLVIGLLVVGIWLLDRPAVIQEEASVRSTGFWVPFTSATSSMGYAGDQPIADSVRIEVFPTTSTPEQYRFTDTLFLYLTLPPTTRAGVQLEQNARTGRYMLTLNDSTSYPLERGFRQLRPLVQKP